MPKIQTKCRINGCNSVRSPNTTMFKVPCEKEMRKKWIAEIELHQPFNYYLRDFFICENHFYPSCYFHKGNGKRLYPGAIPNISLFPFQKTSDDETSVASIKVEIKEEADDNLTNVFEDISTDSVNPLNEKPVKIETEPHYCKKSINLEIELNRLKKRIKQICDEKSAEIERLKTQVRYYQKRLKSTDDKTDYLKPHLKPNRIRPKRIYELM